MWGDRTRDPPERLPGECKGGCVLGARTCDAAGSGKPPVDGVDVTVSLACTSCGANAGARTPK